MICIGITGGMRTTPSDAMEVILSILPMDIYIYQQCWLHTDCCDQWTTYGCDTGHKRIPTRAQKINAKCWCLQTEWMMEMVSFNRNFNVIIPNRDEWYESNPNPLPQKHVDWKTKQDILCYCTLLLTLRWKKFSALIRTERCLLGNWFWTIKVMLFCF